MVSSHLLANPDQASTHSIWAPRANRIEEGQMSWHGNRIEFVLKMNIDFDNLDAIRMASNNSMHMHL